MTENSDIYVSECNNSNFKINYSFDIYMKEIIFLLKTCNYRSIEFFAAVAWTS